ncbi:MAG: ROK family glucokinase [Lachnospiraceae bacterium]|nr:ROK family glucokinase [Lachnospiraceae bacterium]
MGMYCFGIDVGGTTVKCGLFKIDGTLVEKWEITTHSENSGERILPDVAQAILDKCQTTGIPLNQVSGVGVGVPGPVKADGTLDCAVNLHWGYKNIVKELEDILHVPVKAANDANVAALGEMWKGGGTGANNMIMVTLGTGVGGGIIVDGKIVAGSHGAGGEIGHAHVEDNMVEPCNCGNRGCLEQFASATGIARMAREELNASQEPSLLRQGNVSAKTVFDAYKEKDDLATRVVERFGNYLGTALACFSVVVDPDVIVLGGGVSRAGDVLIDCVGKYYREDAFQGCKDTQLVLARLGNDAGIYGAAKLIVS